RVKAELALHHSDKPIMTATEVHRLRRHHDPDVLRRKDHGWRNTAAISPIRLEDTSPGKRTRTPATSISMCPDTGAVSRRSGLPPTTSGTNDAAPSSGSVSRPSRASLRHVVRYCGATPCRSATSLTRAPSTSVSATIRAFTSSGHLLRPVGPSSTSSRETRPLSVGRKVCKVFCKESSNVPQTMDLSRERRKTSLGWGARAAYGVVRRTHPSRRSLCDPSG